MEQSIINVADSLLQLAHHQMPVGGARIQAALLYKNKIIAQGWNHKKTHTFYNQFHPWAVPHAETHCLHNSIKLGYEEVLHKCVMVVVRSKKVGGTFIQGLSKPCKRCQYALDLFAVRNVYYTVEPDGLKEL